MVRRRRRFRLTLTPAEVAARRRWGAPIYGIFSVIYNLNNPEEILRKRQLAVGSFATPDLAEIQRKKMMENNMNSTHLIVDKISYKKEDEE